MNFPTNHVFFIAKIELQAHELTDLSPEFAKQSMKTKNLCKPKRNKMNLTIHPEIKEFATELSNKRRRSLSQLFEDLVETEWNRINGIQPTYPQPLYTPLQQLYQPQPTPAYYGVTQSPQKTY